MMIRWIKLLFIVLLITCTKCILAHNSVVISLSSDIDSQAFLTADKLVQQISLTMATPIKLIYLPAKRATLLLSSGEIHAELARIPSYQQSIPLAIKVPEPIFQTPYFAYTVSTDFKVNGWQSLKPYKIVTVRGRTFVDEFLSTHRTEKVDSTKAALRFLQAGRADIFIAIPYNVELYLNQKGSEFSNLRKLYPAVAHFNLYTFFAEDYSELARDFNRALIKLKEDGQYQAIVTSKVRKNKSLLLMK